jgi:hypothetical protein
MHERAGQSHCLVRRVDVVLSPLLTLNRLVLGQPSFTRECARYRGVVSNPLLRFSQAAFHRSVGYPVLCWRRRQSVFQNGQLHAFALSGPKKTWSRRASRSGF